MNPQHGTGHAFPGVLPAHAPLDAAGRHLFADQNHVSPPVHLVEFAHSLSPGHPGEGTVGIPVADGHVETDSRARTRQFQIPQIQAPLVAVSIPVALPGRFDHLQGLLGERSLTRAAIDEVLDGRGLPFAVGQV